MSRGNPNRDNPVPCIILCGRLFWEAHSICEECYMSFYHFRYNMKMNRLNAIKEVRVRKSVRCINEDCDKLVIRQGGKIFDICKNYWRIAKNKTSKARMILKRNRLKILEPRICANNPVVEKRIHCNECWNFGTAKKNGWARATHQACMMSFLKHPKDVIVTQDPLTASAEDMRG